MKAPKSIIASGRRPAGVRTVVLVVLALIALAVAAHWVTRTWWQRAEPPPLADPRLTYDTLFRNVRPDVKYVGDAACADCHADHATSYRRHSMGHAFAPVSSASPLERYDRSANNPFESL